MPLQGWYNESLRFDHTVVPGPNEKRVAVFDSSAGETVGLGFAIAMCDASPNTMACSNGNQKLPYLIGTKLPPSPVCSMVVLAQFCMVSDGPYCKPGSCEVISQSEPSIEWIAFGSNLDDGPSTALGALQVRFEGYRTGAAYLRLLCGTASFYPTNCLSSSDIF